MLVTICENVTGRNTQHPSYEHTIFQIKGELRYKREFSGKISTADYCRKMVRRLKIMTLKVSFQNLHGSWVGKVDVNSIFPACLL